MTTHTDRIKQMAQEAGFSLHSFNAIDGDEVMAGEYAITGDLIRFAQLVAEDCARVADENGLGSMSHHVGDQIRAMFSDRGEPTPIEIIPGISLKAKAELIERGIKTLEQAKCLTDAELLNVPSVGRRTLNSIRARYSLKD